MHTGEPARAHLCSSGDYSGPGGLVKQAGPRPLGADTGAGGCMESSRVTDTDPRALVCQTLHFELFLYSPRLLFQLSHLIRTVSVLVLVRIVVFLLQLPDLPLLLVLLLVLVLVFLFLLCFQLRLVY